MSLSDESIVEYKEIYKKEYGKEISDSDAREQGGKLVQLFDILWKASHVESRKERRLKTEPDGFPVEGSYSCMVCGNSINETTGWYHWGGPRCLHCHKAIKDGIIPFYILKNRDSYYSVRHLKDKFGIKSTPTIKKLIKEGKLKARTVMNGDRVHEYIFLKKENPSLVERWNPVWKSHQRNRHKVADKYGRDLKKKMIAEYEQMKKKYKLKSHR